MAPLSDDYTLLVRQGPERAKVAGPKEKGWWKTTTSPATDTDLLLERKPVDPPPIVQLHIRDPLDPAQWVIQVHPYFSGSDGFRNYLQSPYLFMCANLCNADSDHETQLVSQSVLSGTLVSSLHRLKDTDNSGRR